MTNIYVVVYHRGVDQYDTYIETTVERERESGTGVRGAVERKQGFFIFIFGSESGSGWADNCSDDFQFNHR